MVRCFLSCLIAVSVFSSADVSAADPLLCSCCDALPGPERPTLPGGGCCRGDEIASRPQSGSIPIPSLFGRVGLSGPGRA
jgi:hypothetical protein